MNIIIFLIILLVLVLSHEFGHFIIAKLNKIRVDEFSFGFPPKLFGKKIGETEYNFNAIPFGGYVKIYGENMEEADFVEVGFLDKEKDKEKIELSKRNLAFKPKYIQALVMTGGVIMNFLVAWILLSVGYMSGLPTSAVIAPNGTNVLDQALTIVSVLPDSPAQVSGLKSGDKILALETEEDTTRLLSSFFTAETVQNFVKKHSTEEINFLVDRAGEEKKISVVPKIINENSGAIVGINMDMIGKLKLPFFQAFWEGIKLTTNLTGRIIVGLFTLIKDGVSGHGNLSAVTGPIGIIGVVGDAVDFGFIYLLSFTALISINLAVINLIPFPALDGGRLLFLLIEKIKGSIIKPKVANTVNAIGFTLLMILMLVITYHDIVKLF